MPSHNKTDRIKIMRYLVCHFMQTRVSVLSSMGRWGVDPSKRSPQNTTFLSNSVIHLLHSDQFVLINPHEGTVTETKAPREQWKSPTPLTATHHPHTLTSLHLECSLSQHIVAHKVPVFQEGNGRAKQVGHTWKSGRKRKFPFLH